MLGNRTSASSNLTLTGLRALMQHLVHSEQELHKNEMRDGCIRSNKDVIIIGNIPPKRIKSAPSSCHSGFLSYFRWKKKQSGQKPVKLRPADQEVWNLSFGYSMLLKHSCQFIKSANDSFSDLVFFCPVT